MKGAGKRLRTEHLRVQTVPSPLPYCRVAVIVGKHGCNVVQRNRLRRRLRELIRLFLIPGCAGFDVVFRALPSAYTTDFSELGREISDIKAQLVTAQSDS
jgi:ribonuclease P protein component